MALKFSVSGRIAKPVAEVFAAVADPAQLSRYFTTGGASGPLVAGATVTWDFADFPGAFPVWVEEVVPNQRIVLWWGSADDGAEGEAAAPHDNKVTMTFEALEDGRTLVTITEEGWRETRKGIEASQGNVEGWTGMLIALKLWVERGINLREGFYK